MLIRAETETDPEAVHAVNAAAFETPDEVRLVDALRARTGPPSNFNRGRGRWHGSIPHSPQFSLILLLSMAQIKASASADLAASPEVVYGILADYRDEHPHILPKRYFSALTVEQDGNLTAFDKASTASSTR